MKLATLKDSTRDGKLVVVSRDLTRCSEVGHIARTLQAALDDWAHAGPRLARVAEGIETGSQPTIRFHEHDALSPLPRAYQWADGSAYVNHVELVRKARNAEMPSSLTSRNSPRRCRVHCSLSMAAPTSTMSSWCARRAAPRCRRPSTPIR